MKNYNCIHCKKAMIKNGTKIIKYNCYDCAIIVYQPWLEGFPWIINRAQLVNGKYKYITIEGNNFDECEKKYKLRAFE